MNCFLANQNVQFPIEVTVHLNTVVPVGIENVLIGSFHPKCVEADPLTTLHAPIAPEKVVLASTLNIAL